MKLLREAGDGLREGLVQRGGEGEGGDGKGMEIPRWKGRGIGRCVVPLVVHLALVGLLSAGGAVELQHTGLRVEVAVQGRAADR